MAASYDRDRLLYNVEQRLAGHPLLKELQRERFPASFDEWISTRLKSPKGALLVSYAGSRRGTGGENRAPISVAIDNVVIARATGTRPELLVSAVEAQLDGFRVDDDGDNVFELTVESDEFLDERDRTLIYVVRVRGDRL